MTERKNNADYSALRRQQHYSLTDIAYNALVEAIMNQDFRPGEPISIDSLARHLSMSNTPVREALMRANGQQLVTQKTNHGFIVTDILRPKELLQLFEVRHLLEMHAIRRAQFSADAVENIAVIVARMLETSDGTVFSDFREYMLLDHQFHSTLVEAAGNKFLVDAWEQLHVHLHLSRLYGGIGLFDRSDSSREHQAILQVLQHGNNDKLLDLLSQHIKRVEQSVKAMLEN